MSQIVKNGQTINFFYDGEGRAAYFTFDNETYYYVTNLQGDVIAILDSTGAMVVNYYYDAYGVLLQIGGAMATSLGTLNPLTYRGYVYDHDTGLYYLQSRYYNPEIRQFISPDALISTGQGVLGYNMFAYCNNNPVNFADSLGTMAENYNRDFGSIGRTAPPVGGGSLLGFLVGGLTTLGAIAVGAGKLLVDQISTAASSVWSVAEKAIDKVTQREHSVYVLKDSNQTVQYVGRTKNVDKRKTAHKNNQYRKELDFHVVASGLTYLEARALEQAGMAYHHTINTANKMNNQINGIAPKCWGPFKEIALGTLNYIDNKMTNEILYWTGN